MSLPYAIDLRPIGACNLDCLFCFGPRHHLPMMKTCDALRIIRFIAKHGSKTLVLSGGEPLLIKDLHLLLEEAKSLGLKTILSTNGILLQECLHRMYSFLDWLALPIDASNTVLHDKIRPGYHNHVVLVIELIRQIKRSYPSIKIKLGTVVSSINKDYISGIPSLLPVGAYPDVWKIYQVSHSNYGKDNRDILEISDYEFNKVAAFLKNEAEKYNIPLIIYRNSERNGKYFFIDPNGDVLVIQSDDEKKIGNILENPEAVLNLWDQFIEEKKLEQNITDTYP